MRRLFLLIAVCMIGMVNALAQSDHPNAPAGFTVVPPEESGTGSYVLTFKKAAAEGETLYDWSDISEGGSLSFLSKATSLTIVTEEGCALDDDDTTQIMGSNGDYGFTPTLFPKLEELDMGDAALADNSYLMKMVYAKPTGNPNIKGLQKLKYFVFPKTTTAIPTGVFNENTTLEEIILLENDQLTEIPGNAFQGCRNLSSVRIPDGITTIGENAFQHCAFEAISLPNSLTTIGETAFGDCVNLKTITIPASVTKIGKSAFQGNTSMTDVYVIGNDVKIGDAAFDHNLTQNGYVYNDNNDGTVTIDDWKKSDGTLPLRLHIPNNTDALLHYMNPYLRFLNSLKDPAFVKRALENLGNPDASDEQFVQQTIDNLYLYLEEKWYNNPAGHEQDASLCNDVFNQLQSICQVQVSDKGAYRSEKWETMDGWRYFHSAEGRFNFSPSQPDYAGWWNFMFVAGDLDNVIWPDDRMVDSRWYSAVFPFNMSYDQLIAAYGNGTDVREFTYVNEHTVNGKKKRTVTFNTERNTTKQGRRIIYRGTGESYIEKGVPYMIHPGVRSYNNEGQPVGRTIAGVDVKEAQGIVNANTDLEPVFGNLVDGDNGYSVLTERAYIFKGSYQKCTLPANTFYLGYDPNPKHYYPLAFYVTKADITNGWTAFTSVVQKTGGGDQALAKGTMDFDFIELPIIKEDFGITTRIESVATKTGRMELQKIYNLSGQVVRENNGSLEGLSKGVYVVNGKKIVVR